MSLAPRVVVVGSINTDVITRVSRFPAPGETVLAHDVAIVGGGKGGNAAVAAARLGGRVVLVGRIGDDAFGDARRAELVAAGIDVEGVAAPPARHTGIALIAVNDEGQNTIVVAAGANAELRPEHVARLALAPDDVLLTQLESPLDTVEAALRRARECGATSLLNFAPYRPDAHPLLSLCDVLVANEHEAAGLLGGAALSRTTARDAALALLARGPGRVAITLAADASGVRRLPAAMVTVVDTTAAGDAFTGALGVQLAAGSGFFAAVETAVLVGSLTTTKLGAQPSLPTRAEFDRFRASIGPARASRE